MKYLLAIALFLNGCATTQDRLQEKLPEYITRCGCLLQEGMKDPIHQVNWQNKSQLKQQFQSCQCTMEFGFDDVDNPLVYLKPGTTFYQKVKGYPWDENYRRIEQIKE